MQLLRPHHLAGGQDAIPHDRSPRLVAVGRESTLRSVDTEPEPRWTTDHGDPTERSPAFVSVLRQAAVVSPLDTHVLLSGESGTGKSRLARVIHQASRRARHPFVELSCATLPEGLIESELFGAAAGSHSTARVAMPGKVAAASHGTLFLDEIGELSACGQAKLLQFVQSREYYPLGSTRACRADVRIIAASNIDLHEAVAARRFRADLLYRLEVLPLHLPSLAERAEDIEGLAELFCRQSAERHDLPPMRLSGAALHAVREAKWPGNIRQLEHTVEAAMIRATGEGHAEISPKHLFPDKREAQCFDITGESFHEATRRFQSDYLRRTLVDCGWNVSLCSRRLQLARSYAYSLIRSFGLEREEAC